MNLGLTRWDVTVIACCAANVQECIDRGLDNLGAWHWIIFVTGILIIASKYFPRPQNAH